MIQPQDSEPGVPDGEAVGVVLGSQDATPLEMWIGVHPGKVVQLDDLVIVRSTLPDGMTVAYYGVVDVIRKRFEGTSFDSDAFDATPSTIRLGLGRQRFVAASSAASANHPVAWTSLDLG